MRNLFIILLFLIVNLSYGQYPIVEEFNSFGGGGEWTVDNGGGVQNYGGAENYGTFNLGTTPYLNNTTHTILSPTYDFTDCGVDITISFPMTGFVESGGDVMNFEYFDGGVWNTDLTVTGLVNGTYTNTAIPNTATQFRFQLITDGADQVYFKSNLTQYSYTMDATFNIPVDLSTQYIGGAPKTIQTYYYDITRFTINCNSLLPVELIYFEGKNEGNYNILEWATASEINCDNYHLEKSVDGYEWESVGIVNGVGNSSQTTYYDFKDYVIGEYLYYYRLIQYDFNGDSETFKIIVVDNTNEYIGRELLKVVNIFGQEVREDYSGVKIFIYNDGYIYKTVGN